MCVKTTAAAATTTHNNTHQPKPTATHTHTHPPNKKEIHESKRGDFYFCVGCRSLQQTRVSAKRNWKNQVQLKKKKKTKTQQLSKSPLNWRKQ